MVVYILGALGAVILAVCVWIMVREIRITSKRLKAIIHEPSISDDDRAVSSFTDLLEQAHSNMTIYDDGGDNGGSIYMKEEVVEAVRKKLHDMPEFTIRCYFNLNNDTLFRQAFNDADRVEIQTGTGERPDDTHYKIIDDGRMAYLSRHGLGSSERKFQIIDCTRVDESDFKDMTNSLLGEYKQDIERKFSSQLAS